LNSLPLTLLAGSVADLQAKESMVLTLGNGQLWLGTPPVVLQFILVFLPLSPLLCVDHLAAPFHIYAPPRVETGQ